MEGSEEKSQGQAVIRTYRDLKIWHKAMEMVTEIYRASATFPREEIFGLTAQVRRSAISIPSNIAEGFGRRTQNDYLRFLQIAMGSLFEVQTQLEIAANLEYFSGERYRRIHDLSRELERMMSSLMHKIGNKKKAKSE